MAEKLFMQALSMGISEEMRADPKVFFMGEDVRASVYGAAAGLHDEFGDNRVLNTPLSENGFFGAARVPFLPYVLATFAGMIPGSALYVYAGVMAGDLSGAPDHPEPSRAGWGLEIVGFAATAVVVVFVTRRAQRVLGGKLEGEYPESVEPT